MTLKILLVNPWQPDVFPPPSLGYIQAMLKTIEGVQVKACDIDAALADQDTYDIVAVSFHSFSVKYARILRDHFKGHLICGGHHPSAMPDQMIKLGYDQVVIGEGENAIAEIIHGNRERILQGSLVDINSIPFPDYTGFDVRWTMGWPVISSRGCPFDCSFCASASFWHRKWRMRSANNVINEIYALPTKQFMFEDDNFTVDKSRAFEICKRLEGKGYIWQCASRAETLADKELCNALLRSGCHTIWLGVETLSQRGLDRASKRTTVEKMLSGIETAHASGLETMSQFIIGLPGDTIEDIQETVRNIKRSKIKRKGTNTLWVLPNTEIYNLAKQYGFDDEIYLTHGAPYYTYEQSMETLNYWSNLINAA